MLTTFVTSLFLGQGEHRIKASHFGQRCDHSQNPTNSPLRDTHLSDNGFGNNSQIIARDDDPSNSKQDIHNTLRAFGGIFWCAILLLIVVVAAFNIVSTLVMVVSDRKREIGILKAMGMTRGGILRVFVLQGAWIGVVGTLMGSVLGVVLGVLIDRYDTNFEFANMIVGTIADARPGMATEYIGSYCTCQLAITKELTRTGTPYQP